MDFRKVKAATNTQTRNVMDMCQDTGNIYETVAILGKRANQISKAIKEEIDTKTREFTQTKDTGEEVFENREQIEISRYYEKLPKPSLIATQELIDGELYYQEQGLNKQQY